MDKNNTLFQIGTTVITKFFVMFGAFVVSIITSRFLGPDGKGTITALLVVPTLVVTIADLGIRQSTAFFIGKKIFSTENVVGSVVLLWISSSMLCTLLVSVIYVFEYGGEYSYWLLIVCLLTVPLNLGIQYSRGIMQGKQRIGSLNNVDTLLIIFNIFIFISLVYIFKLGVMGAAITQLTMALFTLLYCYLSIRKEITLKIVYIKKILKPLITKGFSFAIALFTLQLIYRIDVIILQHFKGMEDVGIYSVGTNIAEIIWRLPTAVGVVLFSKSANEKSEIVSINRSVKLIRFLMPILIVFGVAFWIFSPQIITFLFGHDFSEAYHATRILLPGIISFVIVKLLHSDMSGRGYPLFSLKVSAFALILNIGLNLYLIPHYGIVGASVSSTVSYLFASILFVLLYSRREKVKLKDILILNSNDFIELKSKLKRLSSKYKRKYGGETA